MQQIRDLRCKTNDFLMDAESQTSLIFWQQPKSQEEMERQYYHTQLQFLDIRTQMLQEELVLLHMQRDYIVHEHKDLWQMTAQEIDEVIRTSSNNNIKLKRFVTNTTRSSLKLRTQTRIPKSGANINTQKTTSYLSFDC